MDKNQDPKETALYPRNNKNEYYEMLSNEYLGDPNVITEADFPAMMGNSRGNLSDNLEVIAFAQDDNGITTLLDPSMYQSFEDIYDLGVKPSASQSETSFSRAFSAPTSPKSAGLRINGLSLDTPNFNGDSGRLPKTPLDHPHHLTTAQKAAIASLSPSKNTRFDSIWSPMSSSAVSPSISPDKALEGVSDRSKPSSLRRKVHIQCEQKRRSQIRAGFDELKSLLPGCQHKKISKAMILNKAKEYIRRMIAERTAILSEIERIKGGSK